MSKERSPLLVYQIACRFVDKHNFSASTLRIEYSDTNLIPASQHLQNQSVEFREYDGNLEALNGNGPAIGYGDPTLMILVSSVIIIVSTIVAVVCS